MEEVAKGNDEYAAKGNGLLTQMESFEMLFGLKLAHLIFSASEQFSTNLQALIREATRGARLLITHYQSLRAETQFERFYADVNEQSTGMTDEPTLPRYRKRPRRLDDGAAPLRHIVISHLRKGTNTSIMKFWIWQKEKSREDLTKLIFN